MEGGCPWSGEPRPRWLVAGEGRQAKGNMCLQKPLLVTAALRPYSEKSPLCLLNLRVHVKWLS